MRDGVDLVWVLVVPLALFAMLSAVAFLVARGLGRGAVGRMGAEGTAERPWWGNPLVWVGVSALSVFLGLVVAPHFFPGVFLFLPFFWMGKGFRVQRGPRCPRCDRPIRPEYDFCPACGAPVG